MPSKYKLTNIKLAEVSLVDNPANEGARIVLYKRANSGKSMNEDPKKPKGAKSMEPDKLKKQLDDATSKVAELEKQLDEAGKKIEEVSKSYDSLKEQVEKAGFEIKESDGNVEVVKAAEPEYIEIDGEKVLKSAVPQAILKRIEEQENRIAEMEKRAEMEDLRKRMEEAIPNLGGSDDAKMHLLKAVERIEDETAREEAMKALKAADAAVSKLMDEVGAASSPEDGSATAALEALAKEYAKKHDVTYEMAYAEVVKTREGEELVIKARAEQQPHLN